MLECLARNTTSAIHFRKHEGQSYRYRRWKYRLGLIINAFVMKPREKFCAAKVLPNLTNLQLHLDFCFVVDVEHEIYMERTIAKTLSAAINLRSLVIEVIDTAGELADDDTPTTFKMGLEGCKMPRLTTFGLSQFSFTQAEMTNFLQHSQGIREISFKHVEVTSGSWEMLFCTIKDLPLKAFEFENLRGGVAELFKAGFDCGMYEPYPAIKNYLSADGLNPFSIPALEQQAMKNEDLDWSSKLEKLGAGT